MSDDYHDVLDALDQAPALERPDSLRRLVNAHDRQLSEAKWLRLTARGPARAKRVCRKCWTVHLKWSGVCPSCGGDLDDVVM